MMDEPWFRRFAGFSYKPISWQGWLVTVAVLAVAAPLAALSLILSHDHPTAGTICGALFIGVAAAYFVLVMWKLERNYGS